MAMCYPSPYRVGMSSLGYQWITMRLREAGIAAERAFLPDDPKSWRARSTPPFTYETRTAISHFPILGVSLAYELELAGLLELLDLAGIPVLREDRGPSDPVILLGGPLTMANPLCAAPFVDAMILGEADDVIAPAVSCFFDADSREGWLDALAALPGSYIPERHGIDVPAPTRSSDDSLPARSSWLSPDAELSDMFLLEGERGCHRQCTFCVMRRSSALGGMRLVTPERILSFIPEDAHKVGLVGAAISDHPQIVELLEQLVHDGRQVSLSSLRADRLVVRPRMTELLRRSGARTLTVASDGASERLRGEIMKKTKESHLQTVAAQARAHGFRTLKVYMILGLPGETDADIEELVAFSRELAEIAKPTRVALGVAPFCAKRNTPLDGAPYAGIKTVDRRMRLLQRGLKGRVEVRPASSRWAWVEHEMAQRGPDVGLAVLRAWRNGGRFADYRRELEALDPDTRRPWATRITAA